MNYLPVLSIAGSDCSGGAGIQADIKTISALGCYAATVVTAVTVQNTTGVKAVAHVPADIVSQQIEAVMTDIKPKAGKTGMLGNKETVETVASTLGKYRDVPIVVDPVMVSTSGHKLLDDDAISILKKRLLPLATLVTPNIPETEALSGVKLKDHDTYIEAARILFSFGCQNILIKGGHQQGSNKTDYLFMRDGNGHISVHSYSSPTITTTNTHGTGCTLSSAIAALLSRGCILTDAVRRGKEYLYNALAEGKDVEIGKGNGPVDHFYNPEKLIKRDVAPRYEGRLTSNVCFQYITHHNERYDYVDGVVEALKGGCRWIQLRMKYAPDDAVVEAAKRLEPICHNFGATFILDDRVHLVDKVNADGVHLGHNDMPISQARQLLGSKKIIGGTANTFDDIEREWQQGVDYIGCGPFRFTTTKQKLAPVLGIEGYRKIVDGMRKRQIDIPIVGIGGIKTEDVTQLLSTGLSGIAVSGAILNSERPQETTRTFIHYIEQ